jgi:hypothetical protein
MEEVIPQDKEKVKEEQTTETYKKPYHWLEAYHFKKGNKMSTGRPKGSKSMKQYAKEMLEEMDYEERIEFLKKIDEDILWQMAEGRPEAKIEVKTEETPYDSFTKEQKRDRLKRALEELGEGEEQKGSDILNGGNSEISKDGKNSQGSGTISNNCESNNKACSGVVAQESPKNNTNNNQLGDTTTNTESKS